MRKIWNKGHRIRASDKHLVYNFSIGTLLFVFVAVLLLLNMKQLMRTDWENFSLLENGLTLSTYNFITILIATGVCALVAFLYYRFCYDNFKKLLHRQKLARMILENKWYEADTVQDSGFFTDLQSRSREKIVWFPKIYYQMEKGLLHIRCEITLGKYQDQLLRLEDKLESGLYCELTDKTLHDGYIEYILLYDMIANRITIDEVRAENGCLRLMKNLVWEYDALPHALIAGGTGGGKTYFLLTLIEALLHTDAVLYILDPKNADLADLGTVMGNVYHTKEEMIDCVNAFYEGMVQRSEEMKRHPNYKTGENYAYLGLAPCFLIFDEYVAFFEMLGTKESVSLLSQLKKIVMLGRQAGYFLIVACQRPDAKYFSDGIRDNFNFRVGLGRISELGYGMLFGSDVKKSSVSDFKRGMVQEQQSRQTGRLEKQEQRRQNIADKRMELQKAQEARQAQRKADGSATTGATRPHERPATASTIPKPSVEKMQEVKRPATATTSKISEPVKTSVIKERPLSSGASDRKASQPIQPAHRQNVEKVVSQETHQNYKAERTTKAQTFEQSKVFLIGMIVLCVFLE